MGKCIVAWVLVVTTTLAASASAAEQRSSRAFRMGFTPFPHDMTLPALLEMRRFLKANSDILAVHLEHVPWAEAMSGREFHPKMMEDWKGKLEAVSPGGQIYLAVTPLDNGRRGLAQSRGATEGEPIPAELRGKSLDDPMVKRAYLNYCRRAVDFFKPRYLCIGIEVNELYHNAKASWPAYLLLHRYIYDELKKDHKDLPIFASFTVHNMLNNGWKDRAEMLAAFKTLMPQNDLVAVSFYPFMAGYSGRAEAATQWLKKEFAAFNKPYAVAEMGELAEDLRLESLNFTIKGSPAQQADFYEKMLAFAQAERTAFVISFLYRDYDPLWEKIKASVPEAFRVWRDCGLVDEKGTERPACAVWNKYRQMPLAP